jgi:hypothetical protein
LVGRWQGTSGRVFARGFAPVWALGVSLGLAACVEAANDAAAPTPTLAHRQIERREGVSLAPATVAIVSV